jgi:hypothetical protein
MEQRRLRLGDILDDYCPRERRVTNHAVVAMIEDDIRQTRCTTCDAEHVYKGGKAPRRKKADPESTGALYKEVLAGIEEPAPRAAAPLRQPVETVESEEMTESDPIPEPETAAHDDVLDDDSQVRLLPPDEGPVHRQLIRAQLPRPEGLKIERQAPEFTIRQNNSRGAAGGGGFRGRNQGGGNGSGAGGGGHRFGRGPQRGGGRNSNQGFGGGRGPGGQQRQGGPRKRSR